MVVLHGLLPHWSDVNRSPVSRHAYSLHCISAAADYPAWNWLQRPPELPLRRLDEVAQQRDVAARILAVAHPQRVSSAVAADDDAAAGALREVDADWCGCAVAMISPAISAARASANTGRWRKPQRYSLRLFVSTHHWSGTYVISIVDRSGCAVTGQIDASSSDVRRTSVT